MPDGVDDSILALQRLEAEARGRMEERAAQSAADSLKTRAQKLAWEAQQAMDLSQQQLTAAEARQEEARKPGKPPLEAADLLVQGKAEARDAQTRLVKARARLNFALDQMDEAERRDWDALRAGARADAQGQLAAEESKGSSQGEP